MRFQERSRCFDGHLHTPLFFVILVFPVCFSAVLVTHQRSVVHDFNDIFHVLGLLVQVNVDRCACVFWLEAY